MVNGSLTAFCVEHDFEIKTQSHNPVLLCYFTYSAFWIFILYSRIFKSHSITLNGYPKQAPKSVFVQLKKKPLIFRGTGLMAVLIETEV